MNKIFIIGNGFDLAHNLKTSYSDFICWYLNKTVPREMETGHSPKGSLIKINPSTNFIIDNFRSIEDVRNFFINYRSYIRPSYNTPFFKKIIDDITEYRWVDIELEYYNHIKMLYKALESEGSLKREENLNKVKELNVCFETIKTELISYLGNINMSDLKIDSEIDYILTYEIGEIGSLRNTSQALFINFNYTNTLNAYIEYIKNKPAIKRYQIDIQTIDIHGKLEQDPDLVIFGYGDELDPFYKKIEEINDNSFLKHMKSFSYFKTSNYRNISRFIDSTEFEVHIMGHSCGLSDRLLLNSIFESNNCKGIKIHYYQKSEVENDFFEKTQEISRHFRSEFKNEMRKKIIPFEESSPLVSFKG